MEHEAPGLGAVALAACTLLGLTALGAIDERTCSILIAIVGAATLASFVHRRVAVALPMRGGAVAAAILAAMTAAEVVLPVATSLAPGEPVVVAELDEGEHLQLPAELHGSLRLVVHANIPATDEAAVDYRLEGLPQPLSGHLERVPEEPARRTNKTPHLHDTEVQLAELVGDGDLVLRSLRGSAVGPLEVSVFRERWPLSRELLLVGFVLLAAVALSLRHRASAATLLPAIVAAGTFGMMVVRWLTPAAPLGQELAALFVATIVGTALHAPCRWLSGRRAPEGPAATKWL